MNRRFFAAMLLATLALFGLVGDADSQDRGAVDMPDSFDQSMPLFSVGLGPLSRTVTTDVGEAQAFFDQGLQLMYAFTPEDAARSFREAQIRDPNCAMCFWGEAWAWGPYMNGRMDSDDLPRAQAAIRRAKELAGNHASRVERGLIETMAIRYEDRTDPTPQIAVDTT